MIQDDGFLAFRSMDVSLGSEFVYVKDQGKKNYTLSLAVNPYFNHRKIYMGFEGVDSESYLSLFGLNDELITRLNVSSYGTNVSRYPSIPSETGIAAYTNKFIAQTDSIILLLGTPTLPMYLRARCKRLTLEVNSFAQWNMYDTPCAEVVNPALTDSLCGLACLSYD